MEEATYTIIMKQYFTREGFKLLLAPKNEHYVAKVNSFQCKLLPQRALF